MIIQVFFKMELNEQDFSYYYPVNSPYNNSEGFFHHLTTEQADALLQVQKWVVDDDVDMANLTPHTLHPVLTLLRYLRANGFDAEKAIEHMSKNIEWRAENKVDELTTMNPEDILGCSLASLTTFFPHWHCGYDTTGRPVLYKQYGKFDVGKLKEITSIEAVIRYHVWEQEACLSLCVAQSHKKGAIIETCTAVLDVQDMKLSQVTSQFLALVKGIASVDKDQYPETLGRLFIINVPSVFPLVWRTVQYFLDPKTAAKIQIYGSRDQWFPVLAEFIGEANMPSTYGGTMPPLSSEVHSDSLLYLR